MQTTIVSSVPSVQESDPVQNREWAIHSIIKRDGREVSFTEEKITQAMNKAFLASGQTQSPEYLETLAHRVICKIMDRKITRPGVEEIQDMVENVLMEAGHVITAKKYMLYRADRTKIREMNTRLMKAYEDITFKDAKESNIKRENANVNGDTAMGVMLKYGSEGAKQFCKIHVLKPEHSRAHEDGDIHIHDLDFYSLTTTCCQIDLLKLFKGGFCTGHGVLREPNDIQSYSALACIAIQSNQNDQHGGQSVPNFDYGMAPGIIRTFQRLYRQNLIKAVKIHSESEAFDDRIDKSCRELIAEGLELRLENHDSF
ncbi:MAG: anaerobic ribonucleoside-triphosphate reductase, partial [Planctomycetia bacterium]|nr:anaerobic ribonucleoside-triphosphate reductase [Planctomycetia bacterium]